MTDGMNHIRDLAEKATCSEHDARLAFQIFRSIQEERGQFATTEARDMQFQFNLRDWLNNPGWLAESPLARQADDLPALTRALHIIIEDMEAGGGSGTVQDPDQ